MRGEKLKQELQYIAETGSSPHARGKASSVRSCVCSKSGSSPHARGKVLMFLIKMAICRIIPACAGKRSRFSREFQEAEDHPRMRGEKERIVFTIEQLIGSSPHARGKEAKDYIELPDRRIIPACAGKSSGALKVTPGS